jgi:hypothetical protein
MHKAHHSSREHKLTYPLNETRTDIEHEHMSTSPLSPPVSKKFNRPDVHYLGRVDDGTPRTLLLFCANPLVNIDFQLSLKEKDALGLTPDLVEFFKIIFSEKKLITDVEQTQVVLGNDQIFDFSAEGTDYRDKGKHHNITINFLLKVADVEEFLKNRRESKSNV